MSFLRAAGLSTAEQRAVSPVLKAAGIGSEDEMRALVLSSLVSRGVDAGVALRLAAHCLRASIGDGGAPVAAEEAEGGRKRVTRGGGDGGARAAAAGAGAAAAASGSGTESEADEGAAAPPAKAARRGGARASASASGGAAPGRAEAAASSADGGDSSASASPLGTSAAGDVWTTVAGGSLLVMNGGQLPGSVKIAAFDMDGCLIETKSGKTFPVNRNDWQLRFPLTLPAKMRKLHADGYKLVIITNQNGVAKQKTTVADVTFKVSAVAAAIGVKMQALAATQSDQYRKPAPGMWRHLVEHCNAGVAPDLAQCLFIGDAAGRPAIKDRKIKKDFSSSDYMFALNIGATFHTPEAFFGGSRDPRDTQPAHWELGFDPRTLRALVGAGVSADGSDPGKEAGRPEVVVLVGYPAAGKSTFCAQHLPAHTRVNQDVLGTVPKCRKVAADALGQGKSVVIDATNKDRATRRVWVDLAKEFSCPARCIYFDVPREVAEHLNAYRGIRPSDDQRHVPGIAFNMFKSRFEMPTTGEGFAGLSTVRFVPGPFASTGDEDLFFSFLTA